MSKFETAKLGDVVESMKNGIYKPASAYAEDGIACLRMYNIDQGKIVWRDVKRMLLTQGDMDDYELLPGDLLVNRVNSRELVGKSAVIPEWQEPVVFESKNIRVRLDKKKALPKFVNFQLLLNGSRYFADNAQQVVGMASVNQKQLSDFPLVLTSLSHQEEIIAEIEKQFSRLDEAVTALKRIQANLKRYKAAVLKAAVEGKLTEQWRKEHLDVEPADQLLKRILAERRAKWEAEELAKMNAKGIKPKDDSWKKKYKEPAGPDTANLPELPEGWVWSRSDQLFSFVTSGSRGWATYYSETGAVFLRMGNLDHHTILLDLTDIQRVQPPEGSEGLRTRVCAGDILVSITADVGMVGMVPEGFEEAYINQHVALARPLAAINSSFLAWYLASKTGQDQFKDLQRGATKVGLGLDDIKSVNVPIPPVKEQKAILEEIDRRLSVTEELEATIEINLKRSDRLRQQILHSAFLAK